MNELKEILQGNYWWKRQSKWKERFTMYPVIFNNGRDPEICSITVKQTSTLSSKQVEEVVRLPLGFLVHVSAEGVPNDKVTQGSYETMNNVFGKMMLTIPIIREFPHPDYVFMFVWPSLVNDQQGESFALATLALLLGCPPHLYTGVGVISREEGYNKLFPAEGILRKERAVKKGMLFIVADTPELQHVNVLNKAIGLEDIDPQVKEVTNLSQLLLCAFVL